MLTDGKDAWNYYLWQDEWTSVDSEMIYMSLIYITTCTSITFINMEEHRSRIRLDSFAQKSLKCMK